MSPCRWFCFEERAADVSRFEFLNARSPRRWFASSTFLDCSLLSASLVAFTSLESRSRCSSACSSLACRSFWVTRAHLIELLPLFYGEQLVVRLEENLPVVQFLVQQLHSVSLVELLVSLEQLVFEAQLFLLLLPLGFLELLQLELERWVRLRYSASASAS